MADVFSPKKRSDIMSKVKGRGNASTELRLLKIFGEYDIVGWRRMSNLYGRPDFVFPHARLAVFVDGCFWHGCPIHGSLPKTNRTFWRRKMLRNKKRDREVRRQLRIAGWKVLRLWHHDLREPAKVAKRLLTNIHKDVSANTR